LLSFGKSKDDLNVEIYLNKPAQIGCIQLKLKFNRELDSPYELTLLTSRKFSESITSSKAIGSTVDFRYDNNFNRQFIFEYLGVFIHISFRTNFIDVAFYNNFLNANMIDLSLFFSFDKTILSLYYSTNI
jgi:hypothetical protein